MGGSCWCRKRQTLQYLSTPFLDSLDIQGLLMLLAVVTKVARRKELCHRIDATVLVVRPAPIHLYDVRMIKVQPVGQLVPNLVHLLERQVVIVREDFAPRHIHATLLIERSVDSFESARAGGPSHIGRTELERDERRTTTSGVRALAQECASHRIHAPAEGTRLEQASERASEQASKRASKRGRPLCVKMCRNCRACYLPSGSRSTVWSSPSSCTRLSPFMLGAKRTRPREFTGKSARLRQGSPNDQMHGRTSPKAMQCAHRT